MLDALRQYHLLEPAQLAELARDAAPSAEPRGLARELVRRGWLTTYQANELVLGRAAELLLGSYVLLEKLGEGGMGAVFRARNWKFGRIVALKLIRKDRLANEAAVQRFQREIRAAAQLDHPHIVRALDADQAGDVHFLVMEFVAGTDLAKLLKEKGPLSVAEGCEYARQAALGLQHAFERGLVHRDIKPHNLLLASGGREPPEGQPQGTHAPRSPGIVKILDFGLARIEHQADESSSGLTDDRIVMGTLDYIAPEQAKNAHAADIRADLYSLGCTLYQLLTGRVPFPGGSPGEKIARHLAVEPPFEQVRRDVAAVLRKLMAKKPEQRYPTPVEAAQALAAALIPAAVQATDGTEVVSSAHWSDLVPDDTPGAPGPHLPHRRGWLKLATALGVLPAAGLTYWLTRPEPEPQPLPKDEPRRMASPLDNLDPTLIPAEGRVVGQPKELVAVLGERRQRHWGIVWAIACSPNGKWVASGGDDLTVRVWDAATMQELHVLAVAGPVRSLAFSRDSRLLACNELASSGRMWDMTGATPTKQQLLEAVDAEVNAVAFSPKEDLFAAGCADGKIRLWRLTGEQPAKPTAEIKTVGPAVTLLAFAPNGRSVASGSGGVLQLWDVDGAALKWRWDAKIGAEIRALAFAPNGSVLATSGTDAEIRFWDPQQPAPVSRPIESRTQNHRALAFSPDSGTLAVGGWESVGLVRVKGTETSVLGWPCGARLANLAVAFAPDGKTLYSSGYDGWVHAWDVTPKGVAERNRGHGHGGGLGFLAFTPDDRSLAAAGFGNGIWKWDLTGTQPAPPEIIEHMAGGFRTLAFAQDGKYLAAGGVWSVCILWDLSGKKPRVLHQFPEPVPHHETTLAVAPSNQEIAIAFSNETVVHRWRIHPGGKLEELAALKGHPHSSRLAYSPDGAYLASIWWGGVRVGKVDGDGSDRPEPLKPHQGMVHALTYSPDGRLLATGDDRFVRLWNPDRPGQLPIILEDRDKGHKGPVLGLAFTPDGKQLASSDRTGIVNVWDVARRKVIHRWKLGGPVYGVTFASDGRHLATANGNGTAYILRLSS